MSTPDETASKDVVSLAEGFLAESRRVRRLQAFVLGFACALIAVLVYLLSCVIETGFNKHLGAAEQMLLKVIENSNAAAQASPAFGGDVPIAAKSEKHLTRNGAAASVSTSLPDPALAERNSLHALLSAALNALTYSTVAVISIFLVAITVIVIAIARAVFAMNPHRLNGDGDPGGTSRDSAAVQADSGYALPGLEFAKEIVKLVVETAKGAVK